MGKTHTSAAKKKNPERQRRTNQYDKVIKENMRKAIPGICKNVLGIAIVHLKIESVELHHTRERKADFIATAILEDGRKVVLHVEFQLRDDKRMVNRELEYKAMLIRKFPGYEVLQYVVFLGRKSPAMPTELQQTDLTYRFNLVPIAGVDYRLFLASSHPEEILFAAIANHQSQKPLTVLTEIVQKVQAITSGGLEFQRYMAQLRVLTNLRTLHQIFDKIMLKVSEFWQEEKDPLFKRGELKKARLFVINLLTQTDFSEEKIAAIAVVSVAFVRKVKKELAAEKNGTNGFAAS